MNKPLTFEEYKAEYSRRLEAYFTNHDERPCVALENEYPDYAEKLENEPIGAGVYMTL